MAKPKKLSPEQLEHLYQEWLLSKECELKEKILAQLDQFEELNEITNDFVNKYQTALNLVASIPTVFKIKKVGLKAIPQDAMRTAFFGGVNKRDEPFKIDDTNLDFKNKDVPKNSRHVKLTFLNLIKVLRAEHLESINFVEWKKTKVVYAIKEFSKHFKEHVKKGHQETKSLMNEALAPLISLMKANFKLVTFEMGVRNHDQLLRNFFKFKASIFDFARFYQPCQAILYS